MNIVNFSGICNVDLDSITLDFYISDFQIIRDNSKLELDIEKVKQNIIKRLRNQNGDYIPLGITLEKNILGVLCSIYWNIYFVGYQEIVENGYIITRFNVFDAKENILE